mmetsp:Transcript_13337/g.17882  ORF Transcript_13337/g.17882 Transcript_13337/m.17882 type:complete len:717 (+) Transcript_13337:113-2263(+)
MSDIDSLEAESASLDGYFSDAPLDPKPKYPELKETFETAVIITNLPKVPESKVEKLTKVVTKLVSRIGALATSEGFSGVHLPFSAETKSTLGFALIEYESGEVAKKAVEVLSDYAFDKNHALRVTPYAHGIGLKDVEEGEFKEPEPAPFVERPDTSSWLRDGSQREQLVTRFGKETVVAWYDGKHEPATDYDGSRESKAGVPWCDYYVQWSPRGSYLATMVPSKGVILWGGKDYEKLGRFPAPGVEFVLFSPQENYLLTSNNSRTDPNAIKVFSVSTCKLLRAFPLFPKDFLPDNKPDQERQAIPPPPFHWSHDDKYLARMGKDLISIFETPTMKLLDKRSLSAEGIHEFQFCPTKNIIAYWAPEHGNAPAHVDLIQLPNRKKLRQKNLFNVTKCSMVWQNDGDYLGVKVTRHTKSRKTLYNNLELFRLNEQGIPVEMLDIKDAVMAFAWEPSGSRFAMVHAENPSSTKVDVTFYDMLKTPEPPKNKKKMSSYNPNEKIAELNKLETLQGRQCNCIFWSPAGSHIILASLGESASGTLDFYDCDNKTLVQKEHYRAMQVLWSPSGRSVATIVSQPIGGGYFKFAMDNGYTLWSFQGKQIHQASFETFYQLQWRPREKLLSKEERAKIVKNLKKYEKQFDKADRERARARYIEETKGKRALRTAYRERLAALHEFRRGQKEARMDFLGGYDSEDESNYVYHEVTLETILSTKEDVVY